MFDEHAYSMPLCWRWRMIGKESYCRDGSAGAVAVAVTAAVAVAVAP